MTFRISQQRNLTLHCGTVLYGSGRYYVGMSGANVGEDRYLRNDGKVMKRMQRSALEPEGTYFLTQQDAQDCLDRYNAATNESHQDTKT